MNEESVREHITQIRVDVGVIKAHVETILHSQETYEAENKLLRDRVELLEKSRVRDAAYAAGFGTGIGGTAVGILMKLVTVFPMLLLLGCTSIDPPNGAEARWMGYRRPVTVETFVESPECQDAVDEALAFWRAQGVDYLIPGEIKHYVGSIAVVETVLPEPENGRTESRYLGQSMAHATVYLDKCDAETATHEIGHALGLQHNPMPGTVMFWAAGGFGWRVSRAELDWVM